MSSGDDTRYRTFAIRHDEGFARLERRQLSIHVRGNYTGYQLVLAALKGLAQGYFVTAPAMLEMRLVGQEGTLGTIQAISGIASSLILYIVGRAARPEHRIYIFFCGLSLFLLGTIVNAVLFSAFGVIVFMICLTLHGPCTIWLITQSRCA